MDSTPIIDSVAAELRAEMARQRLNTRQLAELIGESPFWLRSRINTGSKATIADLTKILHGLGLALDISFTPLPVAAASVTAVR